MPGRSEANPKVSSRLSIAAVQVENPSNTIAYADTNHILSKGLV
ncbi:predicted protein [Histoplasma mississippiense (nom. inval.)]|nr:predicted protein [Histoplasma mississippiense (nom. inval.)]EDN02946.1 predicted protein [Histoplasma mississippiense (nom. inval.)]